jgi:uncharacterized protein YvpB
MKTLKTSYRMLQNCFLILLVLMSIVACRQEVGTAKVEPPLPEKAETLPAPNIQVQATASSLPIKPSPSPDAEPSPTANPEPNPTVVSTEAINLEYNYQESHYIRGIAGHSQYYYLSCESSAAVDWAWFFGINIYEATFQADMPRSDNPDIGYVGDFTTRIWGQIPPYSYGVHAGPIAEGLRAYDLPAVAVKNFSLDEIKQLLSEDKPVIVWIIGNLEYSEPVEYVDKAGNVAIVAPYEHVVILTGYNEESVRYMNNGKFFEAPTEVFLTSWGVLGNMAVIYQEEP